MWKVSIGIVSLITKIFCMQLVLNTYGIQLSQRNHCFQVEAKTGNRIISPGRITSILVTKSINITSSAIILAAEHSIPIVLVDVIGQPIVKINSLLAPGLTSLRKQQLSLSKTVQSLQIVKAMLQQKMEGQLSNLAWWANRQVAVASACLTAKEAIIGAIDKMEKEWQEVTHSVQQASNFLRSWEALTARYYWQGVAAVITNQGWRMEKRSYHPAEDECNAGLNYLYGMLYNQVETALTCAGLDSQIGLWHRDNYQTPSLAFDAIEPLRPRIDRLLAELIISRQLETGFFEENEAFGFIANKKGKVMLITSFNALLEERIKMDGNITAFKNHILQIGYSLKSTIQSRGKNE